MIDRRLRATWRSGYATVCKADCPRLDPSQAVPASLNFQDFSAVAPADRPGSSSPVPASPVPIPVSSFGAAPPLIVCGWHTPNYRAWAFKLITSLDDRGIPHDIVEVPKLPGSWEANTMAKPAHLLDAMDRTPTR